MLGKKIQENIRFFAGFGMINNQPLTYDIECSKIFVSLPFLFILKPKTEGSPLLKREETRFFAYAQNDMLVFCKQSHV